MRAVKETEEHNESHVDLPVNVVRPPVTMSAILNCVNLAWKHPRRWLQVIVQITVDPLFHYKHGLACGRRD